MPLMDEYRLVAWVRRGSRRLRILQYLSASSEAATGSRIGRELGLSLHKVSASLRELRAHGLIDLLNPSSFSNRLYVPTALGRRVGLVLCGFTDRSAKRRR